MEASTIESCVAEVVSISDAGEAPAVSVSFTLTVADTFVSVLELFNELVGAVEDRTFDAVRTHSIFASSVELGDCESLSVC